MTSAEALLANEEDQVVEDTAAVAAVAEHASLKHHLLGPSLTKAGQDTVDQRKVGAPELPDPIHYLTRSRFPRSSTMPARARSSSIMKKSRTRI